MSYMDKWFERSLNFDSEGGGGGGGGSSDDGVSQEELERQAKQAVEEGRAIQKITSLLDDNYKQREQLRQVREQLPGDDEVVLSPEEADELRELGALSEDGEVQADKVSERLSDAEEAQQKLQKYERKEQRRKVYEATGLNEEAAEDILPDDVEYETETVEGEDGEETKAFVSTEDGRIPVGEYIEETYSKPIQDALYADSEGSEEEEEGPSVPEQTPSGEDTPGPDEPDDEEIKDEKRGQVQYHV